MAVIENLPPELLYHILQHVFDGVYWDRADLARQLSLVARSWGAPAQLLLLADIRLSVGDQAQVDNLIANLSRPEVRGRVRGAHLEFDNAEQTRRVPQVVAALNGAEELRFTASAEECRLEVDQVPVEMLKDLRFLALETPCSGVFTATTYPLPLVHLEFSWGDLPHSVLNSLLANVPHLRRLTVGWISQNGDEVNFNNSPILLKLAGQLHHVRFQRLSLGDKSDGVPTFLSECTSLVSLDTGGIDLDQLIEYLSVMRGKLAVLKTYIWVPSPSDDRLSTLASALDLPALSSLKRWRLECEEPCDAGRGAETEMEARWRLACAEKGVEARGLTRRFTD